MSEAGQNAVSAFCHALGGTRPIRSVLIANNGMAAVKFIHSVRAWAYITFGTEKAILLVAMATPEDIKVSAEHIKIADQFVAVPGGPNYNNYANVQLIVEVAEMTRVDAVWPGWGHASENPELPECLGAKEIIFLGPQAKAMAALGDKIESTLIAQAIGMPILPWSGSHVKIPPESNLVSIPDEIYKDACVHSTEEAIARCQVVGYPAMIKAAWGGGGKGIRKVHDDEEVRALFKQVEAEVRGSPIFIMKVASQSRHLEVQLLCDQYGNVAALHSRDCSVQRRHQKIIEEGPITVAPLETTKKLEQAARRLAKSVNYVGAATVEYLYSMETGEYFFLELNPRLQVEHPVTEWIAEINLPAAQVAIGMGIPLWQIPEIRRFYGMKHGGGYDAWRKTSLNATPFDFDTATSTRPKGHCVAVRVTSEDPDDGFKPTIGRVEELSFISKPDVWAYFSIKSGGGIHEFSDSQFGHVFAFGESRALAIANMVLGLNEVQIRGQIRTNVEYSIDLLNALDYNENKIHTGWLDSRIGMRIKAERPPWYLLVIGGALYKASASSATTVSEYIAYLEKGQIPPQHIPLVTFQVSLTIEGRKYTINIVRGGLGSYRLKMNDSEIEAEIHTICGGGLLMQLNGSTHVIYSVEEVAGTRLFIDGRTCLLQNDHDSSKLVAKTPCKLLRYLVKDGSHVDAETSYAEVEVMKMCMPLLSPASGKIHFTIIEGQVMQAGELIAKLDLDDPSAVLKAEPFRGSFPILGSSAVLSVKVHQQFAASLNAARMVLAGYEHNIDEVVRNLLSCLDNPELPFLQWQEYFAGLANRLPMDLRYELESRYREFEGISKIQNVDFPGKQLCGVLEAHLNSCPEKEKVAQEQLVEPLMSFVKSYEHGRERHAYVIVEGLFEDYLSVEELFSDNKKVDVIEHLRTIYKNDFLKVVNIVLSHQGIRRKNKLILSLMEQFNHIFGFANSAACRDQLNRFRKLNHTNYSELALKANQLLEQSKINELRSSIARSLSGLETPTQKCENMDSLRRKNAINERIEAIVNSPLAVEDALIGLFFHSDHTLQLLVVETYVRRLYQSCLVKGSVRMQQHEFGLMASWEFLDEHEKQKNESENEIPMEPSLEKQNVRKWGVMVVIKYHHFLPTMVIAALKEASHILAAEIHNKSTHPVTIGNVMHVAIGGIGQPTGLLQDSGDEDHSQESINKLSIFLKVKEVDSGLRNAGVRVVSFVIQQDKGRGPMRQSFHWSAEKLYYEEEFPQRHLELPLSKYLELDKLKDYDNIRYTPSGDRQWHLYTVIEKPRLIQRMFLRTLVRQPITNEGLTMLNQGVIQPLCATSFTSRSILRSIMSALEELELNAHNSTIKPHDHAHMYLYILRKQQIDDLMPTHIRADLPVGCEESVVEKILNDLAQEVNASVGVKMHVLGVYEWEVKLQISSNGDANGAWRVVVANVTGHTCIVHIYRESEGSSKDRVVYISTSGEGPLHGTPINAQYKPLGVIDWKRLLARKNNMTYCYDFPLVFEAALNKSWAERPEINNPCDIPLFRVTELIFADKKGTCGASLTQVERKPGVNDIGMVAWRMEMSTPEFPSGRTIFLVSNDITFRHGSFTAREYAFLKAVIDVACEQKLPLIYLAGNSGVHIAVAEDVKSCFKVGWSNETNPGGGFQYIYLTPEDYARIGTSVLAHDVKLPNGEIRWVIDTIIGTGSLTDDESGTGAIASAYAKAYNETFTLTYVAGRNIGIGAYLGRLGMRCIQRLDQPIILTGFSTVNKLLGREVYSSHMQLGGPKIMATNGVVHLTVSDDLEGVSSILKWLSFVPQYAGGPLPILSPLDPPNRPIKYLPETSCDPRAAICGSMDHSSGVWLGGIFDKDSFIETLEGWARTVVTGRAKLGGIPVGVIAVDDQTIMQVIPADPMQLDSCERVVPQAGMLWFPDSATKTAQAVMDFNREGLPLFVLANWRGFSGGQRDLFEGILQAGSMIVENLRTYQQPIFIYIPMMGELRGGAWVITDSNINPEHIEMYADRTAKGNVLSPEGIVEIKFRAKDLLGCMGRLDPELIKLKSELEQLVKSGTSELVDDVQGRIKAREKKLLPLYTQIAIKYAELHDTASRMAAKGAIKEIIDWSNARSFFYRRLHRRVVEDELIKTIKDAAGCQLEYGSARNMIKEWFLKSEMSESSWMDDDVFFAWKDDRRNYEERLQELRVERLLSHLGDSTMDLEALPLALASLLKKMDSSIRDALIDRIRNVLPTGSV